MKRKKSFFSIRFKIYSFVFLSALLMAAGVSALAFYASNSQADKYYKRCASDTAGNLSSLADGDYLEKLQEAAVSEEYQALRSRAEEENNEELISGFLKEKDLWDGFIRTQESIALCLGNMGDIKSLCIMAQESSGAQNDMYLVNAPEEPLFRTGCYEPRENELSGSDTDEPVIFRSSHGWVCSAFSPVYASDGRCVCVTGCEFSMDDAMETRRHFLVYLLIGSLLFALLMQTLTAMIIKKVYIGPINAITAEMKKFRPSENTSYKDAGVMELDIKSRDGIGELYHGIRAIQTNIIDHLNDLSELQADKLRAERDIKAKEQQIGRLSQENQKDTLTGVSSKSAYEKKINELNYAISQGDISFALVMVDMNNLKEINDKYGHRAGDQYIRGCCRMVCDAFKHSPVYRIGGDEFIVVLQGQDFKDRQTIVEHLRNEFDKKYNQTELDQWFRYSAAVGMSENASFDTSAALVFKRTEKDMYEDKAGFRKKYGKYR
ncbi:GGDEF domain-containing protein [Ruminococcus sp.]|uniref:GGDEF domain-containing protein n=1 Tax=Ruminococcus sp. TaxID=41978 RepID=UPI0025EEE7B3|nr:GGDEF domain-containing protein [Ruminococcus sp.]